MRERLLFLRFVISATMFFKLNPFTYKCSFQNLVVSIFAGHYAFCVVCSHLARQEVFSGETQLSYTFKKGASP